MNFETTISSLKKRRWKIFHYKKKTFLSGKSYMWRILDSSRFQKYHIYGFHFTGELPMASNRWVVGGNWRKRISPKTGVELGYNVISHIPIYYNGTYYKVMHGLLLQHSRCLSSCFQKQMYRTVCKLYASNINNTLQEKKNQPERQKKKLYLIVDIPLS